MKSNKKSCLSVAILTALSLPNLAQAALEEVIVTAQKREQNLQDVPMAITAVGGELLRNNEINNIQDLTKVVPSLRLTTKDDPSNSSVRIRGVGTDVYSAAVEPNVSIVVDEVPLARNELASFEFSDLERIEVLRGPQGTLFGKNSTAGLVHVISKDPSQEFEAGVRFTHEKSDNFPGSMSKVQFSGSAPLTDAIGIRISGFYKDDQGIYEDIEQDNTGPNTIASGARAKLLWDVSDAMLVNFSVDYQQSDGASTPIAFRSVNPIKAERSPEIQYGNKNRTVKTFGNNQSDTTNVGTSLLMSWDFGATTFTSITGLRKFDLARASGIPDFDGDRVDIERQGGYRELETITQELRLTSNGANEFEYTVGALLFNNKVEDGQDGNLSGIPIETVVGGALPLPLPPLNLPQLPVTFGQTQDRENEVETTNIGLYGQSTWHIRDDIHLTAGARFIHEKMSASVTRYDTTINDQTGVAVSETYVDIPTTSFSDNAVIGTTSLAYDWSENTIVYGTVSTGYRGGAFDLNATDVVAAFQDPVNPEKALNTELGIKSRLFDNRVELNIALFQTVFKDFQAQLLKLGDSDELVALSSSQLANAGELEAKGIEIDFQAKPYDSLFVYGSLLYSENKFNDFISQCFVGQEPGESGGVDEDGNGTCDSQDLAGASLPHSPKVSMSVGGRYEKNFGSNTAYVGVLGRWQDEVQFNTEQHPGTIQEAYSIWNIRLGWIDNMRHIEVAGYINNLFAQSYVVNMVPLSLNGDRRDVSHFMTRDADRTFGLSISYDY